MKTISKQPQQPVTIGSAMLARKYSKNRASPKSLMMSKENFLMSIAMVMMFGNYCYGQYNSNTNVNANSNTVIIQNSTTPVVERVIEKPVYIERYRTVYVDKPQPKRMARELSAPILLHDYLWVYPKDIGNFKKQSDALDIIQNINAQKPYGRNNWRIPTSGELALLENNADRVGLGDDIYLATDHSNGVLRMVSTGKSVVEQETEKVEQRRVEEAKQQRLADERQRQVDVDRKRTEEQRRLEQASLQKRAEEQRKREEEAKLHGATINGVTWAKYNVGHPGQFAVSGEIVGGYFNVDSAKDACPEGWRLPAKHELYGLFEGERQNYIYNGVLALAVRTDEGHYILLPCGDSRPTASPNPEQTGWGLYAASDMKRTGFDSYYTTAGFNAKTTISSFYDFTGETQIDRHTKLSVRCVLK